jgi:hypothetical protein
MERDETDVSRQYFLGYTEQKVRDYSKAKLNNFSFLSVHMIKDIIYYIFVFRKETEMIFLDECFVLRLVKFNRSQDERRKENFLFI